MSLADPSQSFRRRYVILGVLGAGGMGAVFRARQRTRRVRGVEAARNRDPGQRRGRNRRAGQRRRGRRGAGRRDVDVASGCSSGRRSRASAGRAGHALRAHAGIRRARSSTRCSTASSHLPRLELRERRPVDGNARCASCSRRSSTCSPRCGTPTSSASSTTASTTTCSPYFTMELLQGAETIDERGRGALGRRAGRPARPDAPGARLPAPAGGDPPGPQARERDGGGRAGQGPRLRRLRAVHAGPPTATASGAAHRGHAGVHGARVLSGGTASEASDLYAVGAIAYELFAGRYPFRLDDFYRLRDDILHQAPDLSAIDPASRRWWATPREAPSARARERRRGLRRARRPHRTAAPGRDGGTRESFLQAAELVGRDAELGQLSAMLTAAMTGKGGGALIGGESGVGKSRLLDELRARALVDGMVVLRGQATDVGSAGGGPYHVFREVIRGMALAHRPRRLRGRRPPAVVPDLPALIEREVPERGRGRPRGRAPAPAHGGRGPLRPPDVPVLVILEDLHWAGSESLRLLGHLAEVARPPSRCSSSASYRDDERPDSRGSCPSSASSSWGASPARASPRWRRRCSARRAGGPEVVDRLRRETEGNPFFLVEVVRALAEEAGALSRVGDRARCRPPSPPAGSPHGAAAPRPGPTPGPPLLEAAAVIGAPARPGAARPPRSRRRRRGLDPHLRQRGRARRLRGRLALRPRQAPRGPARALSVARAPGAPPPGGRGHRGRVRRRARADHGPRPPLGGGRRRPRTRRATRRSPASSRSRAAPTARRRAFFERALREVMLPAPDGARRRRRSAVARRGSRGHPRRAGSSACAPPVAAPAP